FELLLCHGTVCVVGKIRDLILQLSKSSIYSTKPVGEGVAGARALAAPNPLTVALLAIFYSPSLNEGETEMLQDIRGDQLYQN
ncbi:hypothetical protein JEK46_26950, partial [Klebsiella pneumoniae]|nr:hypothetical protein [Klebsiella pneumoniae]